MLIYLVAHWITVNDPANWALFQERYVVLQALGYLTGLWLIVSDLRR